MAILLLFAIAYFVNLIYFSGFPDFKLSISLTKNGLGAFQGSVSKWLAMQCFVIFAHFRAVQYCICINNIPIIVNHRLFKNGPVQYTLVFKSQ